MGRPLNRFEPPAPGGISRRKFLGQTAGAAAMLSGRSMAGALRQGGAPMASADPAMLRVNASQAVNSFDPDKSLGSSMDQLSVPVVQKTYTPEMVGQWLSAGWGPTTYRNHTELAIEAWHWNSHGNWSDPANQRGYFVGSAEPSAEPLHMRAWAWPSKPMGAGIDFPTAWCATARPDAPW
jgi:hypothetical protein